MKKRLHLTKQSIRVMTQPVLDLVHGRGVSRPKITISCPLVTYNCSNGCG